MQRVDPFLSSLINFDKDKVSLIYHHDFTEHLFYYLYIPLATIEALQPYIDKPEFSGQAVRTKSAAAAGLCEWVCACLACYFFIIVLIYFLR